MKNQNQVLLMSMDNLVEFENEFLSDMSHAKAKKIIKHLSAFVMDANELSSQIIQQNDAKKMKESSSDPIIESLEKPTEKKAEVLKKQG